MTSFIYKTAAVLTWLIVIGGVSAAERPGRKWSTVERLEEKHLEAVHSARLEWAKERNPQPGTGVYHDYRAVIHIHAEDSKHTGGTRPEVLAAAKKTGVQIVMFSDHRGPLPETWRGLRDGVLFFAGSEEEGLLRFPMFNDATGQITKEDLRFLCHIEERYDAPSEGFAGMEIYNRHTDTKDDGDFEAWFLKLMKDKERWDKFAALYKKYPDEIFGAGTDYWPEIFEKWDKETKVKPFTGIGANDAHENQVFNGLMLDPYEVSFRNLSTHILARELADLDVRQSLREGHVYVSHDWLCDPEGFAFVAVNNLGAFTMGDPAMLVGRTTRLVAQTPIPAHIKLFRDGTLKEEQTGERVIFETKASGTYRVEAWLAVDGEERPWIYSNPIYLKYPDLLSMQLPSLAKPENVETKKDITYVDGNPEDESKHKLDLYFPKDKEKVPVFFFLHGGAWTSGDRSQYPPLGNRYAHEGIVTVIPSYRLAPKNPHPAQIEDVAAAFAWTLQHISEYGGDTNKIYIGGHSAGGHLAALLTLDPKYLQPFGFSPSQIKGTICLSGAFDLSDGKQKIFGDNKAGRQDASPLFHIHKTSSPFLITYCEWDYFPLALQAQEFSAALDKAGVTSRLVFVPKQNHISEMLAVSTPDDLTVKSVREFILGPR
jgi:acetyl esterase/lipase